jgi:exodeoxyribonuclease-3
MRIASWNVNGLRAAEKGGFFKWMSAEQPDIVCLQEIKVFPEQLSEEARNPKGYHSLWHSAEKPGYSGTAIYSRKEPLDVMEGIGEPNIDREGRVLIAEFQKFVMINAYFPNSQRDHARLDYKIDFCETMLKVCEKYRKKGKNLVLCGDFNIAHTEIDLKNPKSNQDNAGFLPEERAWLDRFVAKGYIDTFRHYVKDPGHYSWWSYRPGVREKNIGWRLDYHFVNPEFKDALKGASIQPKTKGSDHCPVWVELKN